MSWYEKGITLIELLIVIIVIGILSAVAIPAYLKVRLRIDDREARTNLKILQTAVKSYNIDYGNYGSLGGGAQKYWNTTQETNDKYGTDIPVGGWNYWVRVYPSVPDFCVAADKIQADGSCATPNASCTKQETWHIWSDYATAQDCRCSGEEENKLRCTGR